MMEYLWIPLFVAVIALIAWKAPKETRNPIGCVGRVYADLQERRKKSR